MKRKEIIAQLTALNIAFEPTAPKSHLLELLKNSQRETSNKISRTVNFANGRGKISVAFNKADDEPVEIMMCEEIGKDAWTGEGFALKDLQDALAGVANSRELNFFTDSPGGAVNVATSIRNWLKNRGCNITNTIIGVAASAGTWCIPANKVRAYKNSQFFGHRAMCAISLIGNVDDVKSISEDAQDFLNKTDGQIAQMYSEKTGESPEEMLDFMKGKNGQGTLLTGSEALDMGFVDELIDGEAKNQFSADWLNSAKQKLAALNTLRISAPQEAGKQKTTNNDNIMNKEKMIALLNKWGVTMPENATDEQLLALVEAGKPVIENKQPEKLSGLNADEKSLLDSLKNQLATTRRTEIQNAVQKAVTDGKIVATEIDTWTNNAVTATDHPTNGNPVLAMLNKLEGKVIGVPQIPEETHNLKVESSFKEIARGFEAHNEATASLMRGNDVPMKEISNAAKSKALFFRKFKNRFMEMMNANTIDAGLQRQLILQDIVIRDFKRRVLGLDMFSTVFRNVPLQGLNTVEVPFFDLDSSASTNFVSGTGYTTIGNTASNKKEITVGEDATNGKRKYQALQFSSQEIARQPYLKVAQLAGLKAEKLAFDIEQDVLSIITAANFGAPAVTKAAGLFTSDDLADLKVACKAWPMEGRGLIIDSAYDANLLKDPAFKFALNAASDSAIKEGRLYPRVFGYDYVENPNIPANGENLVGFAFWKYAILVAFAPVPPVDEVRRAGTTWELITDPDTGISLEYRAFGDNVKDQATHVIESSYGYAAGVTTALKRIVTP